MGDFRCVASFRATHFPDYSKDGGDSGGVYSMQYFGVFISSPYPIYL